MTGSGSEIMNFDHEFAMSKFELVDKLCYLQSNVKPRLDREVIDCTCCFPLVIPSSSDSKQFKKTCFDLSCLNFATYVECVNCHTNPYCDNQRLQQKNFPNFAAIKTEHKGYGVKTLEDIKEGKVINEYCGEVIDQRELDERLNSSSKVRILKIIERFEFNNEFENFL